MRTRILFLAVAGAAAVLAALIPGAAAPAASPDYTPLLRVATDTSRPGYAITTQLTAGTITETGRLSLYTPKAFRMTFPATAGAEIGTATVRLQLADQHDAIANLKGTVVVTAPAKLACATSTATPAASLALNVTGGGLTLSIPMAAYTVTGSGATYSSLQLTECLAPAGVPAGTPGRAPQGARFLGQTLTLPGLAGPKNVASVWTSGWTPFTSGTTTLDDTASVAAQAVSGAPRFRLHAVRTLKGSKTYVNLTGRVSRGALGTVRADVNVHYGSKPDKLVSTRSQKTDVAGYFSYETQVAPPYRYFQAVAKLPARTYPTKLCQPSILTYTCAGISTVRDTALSNVVRVAAAS
jgi:hypothetical protein